MIICSVLDLERIHEASSRRTDGNDNDTVG